MVRDSFADLVSYVAVVMLTTFRLSLVLPAAAALGDIKFDLFLVNIVLLCVRLVSALCFTINVLLGNVAAIMMFPVLGFGMAAGIYGCAAGQDKAEADNSANGPPRGELISNQWLLSAFRGCVRRPVSVLFCLAALVLACCGVSTQYTQLKNMPLDLEPFDTRLKDVHLQFKHDFYGTLTTTCTSLF
jgi:hypothetical protein